VDLVVPYKFAFMVVNIAVATRSATCCRDWTSTEVGERRHVRASAPSAGYGRQAASTLHHGYVMQNISDCNVV